MKSREFWCEVFEKGSHRKRVYTTVSLKDSYKSKVIGYKGTTYKYSRVLWNIMNPDDMVGLGDVVHHIDGDRFNDSLSNLQKMTRGGHASMHAKIQWIEDPPCPIKWDFQRANKLRKSGLSWGRISEIMGNASRHVLWQYFNRHNCDPQKRIGGRQWIISASVVSTVQS